MTDDASTTADVNKLTDIAPRIRVLLIDDHAVVREGLRAVLEDFSNIEIVGEASSANMALALIEVLRPNVILSDLRMPGLPMVDAILLLRTRFPETQIVLFSSFAEPAQVRAVLAAGAIGYLTKDALAQELHDAIVSAHANLACVHPSVRDVLHDSAPEALRVQQLAPRERDVLREMTRHRRNKEIARALGMTEGTVKGYINTLFQKLAVPDRDSAVAIALRCGLSPDLPST
jgi:DNA-binding NarL/FixJ family response regulator